MTTLSSKYAAMWRGVILAMSIGSLVMVFQPFSITVFALGCMLAFISALVFNLMPALEPGVSVRQVGRVAITILIFFVAIVGFAILATYGYVLYLQAK